MRLFLSVATLVLGIGFVVGVYLIQNDYLSDDPLPKISPPPSPKFDVLATDTTLKCITKDSIEAVRKFGTIDILTSQCSQELRAELGNEFGKIGDETIRAILATIVAANFAEYGASSAKSYEDIKKSSHLNCGNTIFLVGYLLGAIKSKNLKPIGFAGGIVGNHAQLLFYENGETVLLDPTTGLIAKTNLDNLLRGIPLDENKMKSFSIKDKSINSFRENVYIAINRGKYLPSDFMYMHESLAEQIGKGGASRYFTPGGIAFRERIKSKN
jgi:hypothetical protein